MVNNIFSFVGTPENSSLSSLSFDKFIVFSLLYTSENI
jgi:hypothetical protein